MSEEGGRSRWFLLYARGISYERLGEWDKAEADFRAALVLNPDQPQVLNYLGYSLVEKQMKLDEALDMIERAVSARRHIFMENKPKALNESNLLFLQHLVWWMEIFKCRQKNSSH